MDEGVEPALSIEFGGTGGVFMVGECVNEDGEGENDGALGLK